jgi:hypothetical protein
VATTDKDFVVKNGLVVQGAQGTIDGSVIVTEAALDISLGDYIALLEKGAADGVAELDASSNVKTVSAIVFEGATEDEYELTIGLALDPTADRTITIPDVTGTIVTTGNPNDAYPSQSGQTGKYLKTDGTNVSWATVSGGGSLEALTIGAGLSGTSYDGSSPITIAIDSTVATTSGSQTLTNKTLTSPVISTISNTGTLTLPTSTDTLLGRDTTDTLTNKSISLGSNTISGTISQFNTALSDADFATLAGVETLTNKTFGSAGTSGATLAANLSAATYKITGLGTPTASDDAATKQYVDDVAQGLHIHASCVAATTSNVDLSTDLEAGDIIDGVTLSAGNRVLVKNQSTTSQNGIYTAVTSGAAVRATDFNEASEIQGGDFVFVTGGTANDNTGWVQVNTVTTVGTDPIVFVQFSGAGTYLAGNGLTLTGNTFSINTSITADTSSAQTFTNKTISGSDNTLSNISLTTAVTGTLPIANGGTNITTYTTGDILYASATNTLSKLGAGTEGYVLTISSGAPAWQASSGGSSDPNPQIFLLMGA